MYTVQYNAISILIVSLGTKQKPCCVCWKDISNLMLTNPLTFNFGEQKFHATAYKLLKAPVGAYAHVPVWITGVMWTMWGHDIPLL